MASLQTGKINRHVKESRGADTDIMKFYITEYSSKHGINGFIPQVGKHTGTGYKSNFRPAIHYSPNLDEIDNPAMGHIISDNYMSTTQKSYQPWKGSTGTDPFPKQPTIRSSGFSANENRTLPTHSEVLSSLSTSKSGKSRNRFKVGSDDSLQNGCNYVSENHSQYTRKHPHVNTLGKTIGRKVETGFTHEKGRKLTQHISAGSPGVEDLTGESEMKTSYLPTQYADGGEKFSNVAAKAERCDGFTRSIQPKVTRSADKNGAYTRLTDLHPIVQKRVMKKDPAEFMNAVHANPFPSISQCVYQGRQPHDSLLGEKMRNVTIGRKESTGYTTNNQSYIVLPDDINRYSTVYKDHYGDENLSKTHHRNAPGNDVFPTQSSVYAKCERVGCIDLGKEEDRGRELQNLDPYVCRSLKARDPFYAEQNHTQKLLKSF